MTKIQIILPDQLAQDAQRAGLLQPEAMEALLREAMRTHRIERLFATMAKLRTQTPPLTEEEVQAEIRAARAARRSARGADRR
jgi:hypothetical protein